MVGKDGRSAIGALVERSTRVVMLLHLPHRRMAAQVRDALAGRKAERPATLRTVLTWDQGKAMSEHARFPVDAGVHVFDCDLHRPWQRGSNEHANGRLRPSFPKAMEFDQVAQAHLDTVADGHDQRPRGGARRAGANLSAWAESCDDRWKTPSN